MQTTKTIVFIGLFIALSACNVKDKSEGIQDLAMENDMTKPIISSSAAIEINSIPNRKFIRTAELKFKVKSVLKSTYDIEGITHKNGGFVTYTNLLSQVDNTTLTPISEDSSLETKYYIVTNTITIRVPNTKLDTTLKDIANEIEFLDYRTIKADDVALQILANDLTQKRATNNSSGRLTIAIDNKGKKLGETSDAEEIVLSKQQLADEAKIENLSLTDKISFSTINISVYQREIIKRELISNEKNITAFEPSFFSKVGGELKFGFKLLVNLFLFLLRLWFVFLFLFLGFWGYKKYGYKLKK